FEHRAPAFRDQGDFFFPAKLYTADRLDAGDVPLWNPLSGAGEPWLANAQSGVFYPPTLFFLLPSPALAAALFLLVHFAIGAWGAWRFLREEGASAPGALASAALFAGSGFAVSLSAYWNHFGAFMYLPAIAALARSGLRSRRSVVGLAALVGLQAMAGSPEISGATLLVAALFSFVPRPAPPTGWAKPPRSRAPLRFALSSVLGLALAGWVLVPMGELLVHSDRKAPLSSADRGVGAVGPEALGSFLDLPGSRSGSTYLASLAIGPLGLLLALAGFAERQRRLLALLLLVLALAGAAVSAAGPPGEWLRALPPLDRVRYPAKALAPTFFALAVLAGLGCDALRFATLRKPAMGAALAWIAALALPASLFLAGRGLFVFVPEEEIRRRPDSLGPLPRLAGRVLTPPMRDVAFWALQSGRFDVATLRRQREALLGYTNLLYGVPSMRTAAALPTAAARAIMDSIDESSSFVLPAGAAGARVLLTTFPPPEMGSRREGGIFRAPINPYRPRLSFVAAYRIEPDAARGWARVARGETDLSREVLLERAPQTAFPSAGAARPALVARLAEDRPERVVAEMTSDSAGLLVLADLFYPGWTAEVDGRPSEILRADGVFRAVALPAGSHRVVFRYQPLSVKIGAALSAAALLAVAVLAGRGRPEPG
ncbi:MAG TPA: YfhO family protein, partial [Thermoanaerobaculia bacterium]|nr:YfhO family protein [Thermoanaerobaculia bacterium]